MGTKNKKKVRFYEQVRVHRINHSLDELEKAIHGLDDELTEHAKHIHSLFDEIKKEILPPNEIEMQISQKLKGILNKNLKHIDDILWVKKMQEKKKNRKAFDLETKLKRVIDKFTQIVAVSPTFEIKSIQNLLTNELNNFKSRTQDSGLLTNEQTKEIHKLKNSFLVLKEIADKVIHNMYLIFKKQHLNMADIIESISKTLQEIDEIIKNQTLNFENPEIVRFFDLENEEMNQDHRRPLGYLFAKKA